MKKYFRSSQKAAIVGYPLNSRDLTALGIPFQNLAGGFSCKVSDDSIDILLGILDLHYPKIHAVSYTDDGRIINTYVEGAEYYFLHEGDPDPNIEFTKEFSWDDLPEDDRVNTLMYESEVDVDEAIKAFKNRRGLE